MGAKHELYKTAHKQTVVTLYCFELHLLHLTVTCNTGRPREEDCLKEEVGLRTEGINMSKVDKGTWIRRVDATSAVPKKSI